MSAPNTDSTLPGSGLARNVVLNLLGRILPMFAGLVTMPFIVRGLGPERFGIFSIGWALINFFFLFDLGLGRAATKFVSEHMARKDTESIPEIVWSAVIVQLGLGLVGGLLLAALSPLLVWRVFNVDDTLQREMLLCFLCLAGTIPVALAEFSFSGVLEAVQRFGLITAVRAPINVLMMLWLTVVAVQGLNLAWFFGAFLLAKCISVCIFFVLCRGIFPALSLRNARAGKAMILRLFGFGKWVSVSYVLNPIIMYMDRFLLGAVGNLQDVARYTAPYQLCERISILPVSVWTTLFPAFSTLDGANDHRGVQTLLAKTIKLMAFLMGAVVIGLIFAAHDVVLIFLGRDYVEPSTIVLQILCLGFWVNALAMAPHATLQACNRPDLTAKLHALETPLHLLVLFIFASTMGVVGVATAWLIRASLDCLALMWLTKRLGRLQTGDLQAQGVYSLSVLVAALSCAGLIYSSAIQTDWFGSLAGCVVVLVFLGTGWVLYLTVDERAQVMRLLRLKGRRQ